MIRAVVLADDTTGALELGALLAAEGITTTVSLCPERPVYGVEALVIDTETRHLPPAQARHIIAETARRFPAPYLYKKTDSTLRGNIAAEFQGLLDVYPDRPLHYAPAYPALGRTVVNGTLLVHGVPVAQTEFANDPVDPVRESHIPTLLGQTPFTLHSGLTGLPVSPNTLAAGPGGYARHWIKHLPLHRTPAPALPQARTFHLICGSQHPASQRQARQADVPVSHHPQLPATLPDALIIFGGDTAYRLLTSIGCRELTPLGEVLPGVPVSTVRHNGRRLTLITKAGGFGDENIVAAIQERLC